MKRARLVVAHKGAHVFQHKVRRPVKVGVRQECHDHGILLQGPVPLVKAVHAAETLARRAAWKGKQQNVLVNVHLVQHVPIFPLFRKQVVILLDPCP